MDRMPVSRNAGTGILHTWGKVHREKRVIAAGLCICMVIGISGCGKKAPNASDYAVGRSQEEARAEVRRHLNQDNSEERKTSEEREKDGNDSEKKTESAEKTEKRSELARAAAEEAIRKAESSEPHDRDGSISERYGDDDFHYGERRNDGTFQVDCICFELPEGWEKDEYLSDSYDMIYAPGGDADTAMDCLIVSRVSEAFGMIDMFLENIDEMESMLEEEIAEEDEEYHVTIDDIGLTFLGHTLKIKAVVRDEEEAGVVLLYFAEDDTNLYSLYAYTLFEEDEEFGATAGPSAQLEEALQMFFDTGWVENRGL